MRKLRLLLWLCTGTCAGLFAGVAHGQPNSSTEAVVEVVAIGDVHGAFDAIRSLLAAVGLIDERDRWVGGSTHLVSVGDLIDRGDATQSVLDLFMALQGQARAAGGGVHVLLGNHEIMNLLGEWRDVSPGDLRSFAHAPDADGEPARRAAFAASGRYGRWLLDRPLILKLGDTLFAHGGFSGTLAGQQIDSVNADARALLAQVIAQGAALQEAGRLPAKASLLALAEPASAEASGEAPEIKALRQSLASPYLSELGPAWYRGNSRCPAVLESPAVNAVLKAHSAQRIVVGHTPTWNHQIARRLGGRVYAIDTGMLKSVYGGEPAALRIRGDQVEVLDASGAKVPMPMNASELALSPAAIDERAAQLDVLVASAQPAVASAPKESGMPVALAAANGDPAGSGVFVALSRRDTDRELAAWRLDRWLGLDLVPPTYATTLGRKTGVVRLLDSPLLLEAARSARGLAFDDWCAAGSSYQLVAAFDAVIGQLSRSAQTLAYDRRLTRVRLLNQRSAFGNATRLPVVATPQVLPPLLRDRLKQLSPEVLETLVGDRLPRRAKRALLLRRDAVLGWPPGQGS